MTCSAYALDGHLIVGEGNGLSELNETGAWVASTHVVEVQA